jgi:hypothetical protein
VLTARTILRAVTPLVVVLGVFLAPQVASAAPTGTISAAPVSPITGQVSITGTAVWGTGGAGSLDVTYSGPATGTVCLAQSATPWACAWDTRAIPDGSYVLRLTIRDGLGATSTSVTRTVTVDNTAPIAWFGTFTERANPAYQYAVGTTMYVNGANSGSFEVSFGGSDFGSGLAPLAAPELGTGWLRAAGTNLLGALYTWAPGATSPGNRTAVVFDNVGLSATVGFSVLVDSQAPTGGSLSVPGGMHAYSVPITMSPPSDSDSGVATLRLQRRSADSYGATCGSYGAWSTVGTMVAGTTWNDYGTAGPCYNYRLEATDNVGNVSYVYSSSTVRIDDGEPYGTIDAAPVSPFAGTVTLTGTMGDAASGVASVTVDYDGPQQGTICHEPGAPATTWSCVWDTTHVPDGPYDVDVTITDAAGISQVVTRSVDVAQAGLVPPVSPTVSATGFVAQTGATAQYADGTTLWFNPASTGSFTVSAAAAHPLGVGSVTFPALGTGWSTSSGLTDSIAPYAATYQWSAGAQSPGAVTLQALGVDGGVSDPASFTVTADATGPTGGSLTMPSGVTSLASAPVVVVPGTDAGSGLAGWTLQRRIAALASDTCGSVGVWTEVAGVTAANSTVPLTAGSCLQYRLVSRDRVGNVTIVDPGTTLRVDRTAPWGTFGALPASVTGTVTLSGDAIDATTHVDRVTVRVGAGGPVACEATVVGTRWSCAWDSSTTASGTATLVARVVDAAGNEATEQASVTVVSAVAPIDTTIREATPAHPVPKNDTEPPNVDISHLPPLALAVKFTRSGAATDWDPGSPDVVFQRRDAANAAAPFGAWRTTGAAVTLGPPGSSSCFRATATDAAGNVGTSEETCTNVPYDDRAMRQVGRWSRVTDPTAIGGSLLESITPNAALELKVTSTRLRLVAWRCPRCGVLRVTQGKRVLGSYSLKGDAGRVELKLPVLRGPASTPLRLVATSWYHVKVDAVISPR